MDIPTSSREFHGSYFSMGDQDVASVVSVPLELRILSALLVLLLFLLFLIAVIWDRYGKEIGLLYTPSRRSLDSDSRDLNVNEVADEYSVYQTLPTFFYEFNSASAKKQN